MDTVLMIFGLFGTIACIIWLIIAIIRKKNKFRPICMGLICLFCAPTFHLYYRNGVLYSENIKLRDRNMELEESYDWLLEDYATYKAEMLIGSIQEQSEEDPQGIVLGTGRYVVGEDVEPGKYDVKRYFDSGVFSVKSSKDENHSDICNEYSGRDTDIFFSNLTLSSGNIVEITSGLTVQLIVK